MNDIDYLRLFESLPHCDSMCNIVEDWGYAPIFITLIRNGMLVGSTVPKEIACVIL